MSGPLHLIKLCVGADSVDDLATWQARRIAERQAAGLDPRPRHVTRMWPRRADEILGGGSLFWVMQGYIAARQGVEAFDEVVGEDGVRRCAIVMSPTIVRVAARPRGPFQGWRYFAVDDAPPDVPVDGPQAGFAEAAEAWLPPELAIALDGLGVPLRERTR